MRKALINKYCKRCVNFRKLTGNCFLKFTEEFMKGGYRADVENKSPFREDFVLPEECPYGLELKLEVDK